MASLLPKRARRHSVRYPCRLPATLISDEHSVTARTVNISLGGAMIMPYLKLSDELIEAVRAVSIETLGPLDCELRWVSDGRIGVKFDETDRVIAKVTSFLERLGFATAPRLPTAMSTRFLAPRKKGLVRGPAVLELQNEGGLGHPVMRAQGQGHHWPVGPGGFGAERTVVPG